MFYLEPCQNFFLNSLFSCLFPLSQATKHRLYNNVCFPTKTWIYANIYIYFKIIPLQAEFNIQNAAKIITVGQLCVFLKTHNLNVFGLCRLDHRDFTMNAFFCNESSIIIYCWDFFIILLLWR